MGALIIGAAVVGTLVVVGIGMLIESLRSSSVGEIRTTHPPPTNCAEFCNALRRARTARCAAEAALDAAKANEASLKGLLQSALHWWLGLTAAALAAAAIPFIGGLIAAGLGAAAATAYAVYLVIFGMALAAIIAVGNHRKAVQDAIDAEEAAKDALRDNCSTDEMVFCLGSLTPCP